MNTIRLSTDADTAALTDIWRRAVQATHDFLTETDFREIETLVAERYIPNVELWVAVDGRGRPVGFMGMTGANIDALFIDPDRRGVGVGRSLVEYAESLGGDLTVDVNEQNDQAVGFYRHLGFERVGRSSLDAEGRPYPILHMRRPGGPTGR